MDTTATRRAAILLVAVVLVSYLVALVNSKVFPTQRRSALAVSTLILLAMPAGLMVIPTK